MTDEKYYVSKLDCEKRRKDTRHDCYTQIQNKVLPIQQKLDETHETLIINNQETAHIKQMLTEIKGALVEHIKDETVMFSKLLDARVFYTAITILTIVLGGLFAMMYSHGGEMSAIRALLSVSEIEHNK